MEQRLCFDNRNMNRLESKEVVMEMFTYYLPV